MPHTSHFKSKYVVDDHTYYYLTNHCSSSDKEHRLLYNLDIHTYLASSLNSLICCIAYDRNVFKAVINMPDMFAGSIDARME